MARIRKLITCARCGRKVPKDEIHVAEIATRIVNGSFYHIRIPQCGECFIGKTENARSIQEIVDEVLANIEPAKTDMI